MNWVIKIKPTTKIGFFVILFFVFLPGLVFAQESEEQIKRYDVEVEVFETGDLHVKETIVYDFAENEKRGIFRDIPLEKIHNALDKTKIKNVDVSNEFGEPYMANVSGFDFVSIRIGNPNIYLTGEHTYVIDYDVENAIGYFKEFDEIYWDAIGHDWSVLIEEASVRVIVPGLLDESSLDTASYCGWFGSEESCNGSRTINHLNNKTVIGFRIHESVGLGSYEGMTVAVGFPKGIVPAPASWEIFLDRYAFYFGPLIFAIPFFIPRFLKFRRRRNFYKNNTVVAEYDSEGVGPLLASRILSKDLDGKAFSAAIINLAVKGYIKISKEKGKYKFTTTKKESSDLVDYEKEILTAISDKSETELKDNFYVTASSVGIKIVSKIKEAEYAKAGRLRSSGPPKVMITFILLFLAVNPGAFVWMAAGDKAGFIFSGTMALVALLTLVLKKTKPKLLEKGMQLERRLLGLKLYIDTAEKDRILFHNTPEKSPEMFERLLPFAMIFGLEKKWAKQFEDIYTRQPEWYSDGGTATFSSAVFAKDMVSFSRVTKNTIMSSPVTSSSSSSFGSYSSSSSGSSGGGSSGGGGGGGGGGSW